MAGVSRASAHCPSLTACLAERPSFVRAVASVSDVRAVLPKPKSINAAARRDVERSVSVDTLSRDLFNDPVAALDYLESRAGGERTVLLDVGGYFAPVLAHLHERFSGEIAGFVEDTENGHRRYAALEKLPCPVISVARSPLKDPEDYLVGQSVVFSTEAVMRGRGDILHGQALAGHRVRQAGKFHRAAAPGEGRARHRPRHRSTTGASRRPGRRGVEVTA